MDDDKKAAGDSGSKTASPPSDDAEKTLDPRGVLTNKQFRAAQARARKKVEAEQIEAAMAEVERQAEILMRQEVGFVTGTAGDEMVDFAVDLPDPEFNSCHVINGFHYWHGQSYKVPRHVANSLNETQYRLREQYALQFEGKKRSQWYRSNKGSAISARGLPGGLAA